MRSTPILAVFVVALFMPAPASASHWDASDSGSCRLFGSAACHLDITISPIVSTCVAAGCTLWIDCFWTISGTVASAEGSCNGVPWAQPCGTGSCSGGTPAGTIFVPRGVCSPVTMSGVGHGLVVDSTPFLTATSQICI